MERRSSPGHPDSTRSPTVEAIDLGLTPASHFMFPTLIEIAATLRERLADPDVAGAVVVQGTDTIEETAFAWDLLLDDPKPVVVTGAMRTPDRPDYDGPANLRGAVAAAASPELRDQGVVVSLAGSLEAADDVVKLHTSALDTFQQPELGIARTGGGAECLRRAAARPAAARVRHPGRGTGPPRDRDRGHGRVVDRRGRRRGCRCDRRRGHRGGQHVAGGARGGGARLGRGHPRGPRRRVAWPVARRPTTRSRVEARTWARAGAILAGTLCAPKVRVAVALGLGAGLDHEGLRALLADPLP